MTPRRLLAVLVTVAALLVAGCSGAEENLPPAADLIAGSATAMRQVRTAALAVEVDPALTGILLRSANGSLTAQGDASGTATVNQLGQLVELEFVIVGDQIWFRVPPTAYGRPVPLGLDVGLYDPTAILDPDRGVALLLSSATPGATEAREEVDGVDSYRLAASFGQEAVAAVVPGVPGPVDGLLWIDVATSRLVRAELQVPVTAGGATAPVTVRLSDYDAPVTVTPPV